MQDTKLSMYITVYIFNPYVQCAIQQGLLSFFWVDISSVSLNTHIFNHIWLQKPDYFLWGLSHLSLQSRKKLTQEKELYNWSLDKLSACHASYYYNET